MTSNLKRERVVVVSDYVGGRGEIEWRRPNRVTLLDVLHHPIYAGAYRWGHREIDPRKKVPGRPTTGRTFHAHDDCRVLIRDRLPGTTRALPSLYRLSRN